MGPPAADTVGCFRSNPLIQIKPFDPAGLDCRCVPVWGRLRMDRDVSSNRVTAQDLHREETLIVAALLALAGGYIDAYSWITHRVFANAQTANMLFMWIHAM